VNVSQGPQIVTVPDVTGETIAQASQALAAVGLQVGSIYGPPKADRVLATSPAPHSRIAHGRTVDLYTGR
jgi:serine/threonine-protein kinase